MKKTLALFLLMAGTPAFASRPTIGHQEFPNNYTPHPCAAPAACASLTAARIVDAGSAIRGYSLKQEWVDAHWDEMMELIRPTCAKLATCYATPNNQSLFCTDLLFPEFWGLCDRYPKGSEMNDQCAMFTRIYTLEADLHDRDMALAAQACAAKTPRTHEGTLKVWMSPEIIGDNYNGTFTVYALDTETNVPIQALVTMDPEPQKRLSARAPGGKPWTNYEIRWNGDFVRVPNAAGHTDLAPPKITVSADGYAPVTLTLPATAPKVVVDMSPSPDALKPGKNTLTVNAHDARTGEPVELRVMLGTTILGDTNKPLELDLAKGAKRPEIWTTSLFNRYSDVVVAPAK